MPNTTNLLLKLTSQKDRHLHASEYTSLKWKAIFELKITKLKLNVKVCKKDAKVLIARTFNRFLWKFHTDNINDR